MWEKTNKNTLDRTGEISFNTYGTKMTIIKYINNINLTVLFENGYSAVITYQSFKSGFVANPYDKTISNIGYIGEGMYYPKIHRDIYTKWIFMIERCYDPRCQKNRPSYIGCTVIKEWHNFQNFAKWYEDNYYKIPNETMGIDKDILVKGNKIYSPKTCVFVPTRINSLFVKCDVKRGNYPIGVIFIKDRNNYKSQCRDGKEKTFLGYYSTSKEAFNVYKIYKEKLIKQIAKEYKNIIPKKLYDAMYNYKVEITD